MPRDVIPDKLILAAGCIGRGSAWGPVTLPVFKTGGRQVSLSLVCSTRTRFRQSFVRFLLLLRGSRISFAGPLGMKPRAASLTPASVWDHIRYFVGFGMTVIFAIAMAWDPPRSKSSPSAF